ncbi:hypothetical protein DFJ73DRAFT_817510 [Zopfochytrium polystomum]|nr:hypothetical protein DFJ73DRAFT_817510 [Zopfochytrium polystomum]
MPPAPPPIPAQLPSPPPTAAPSPSPETTRPRLRLRLPPSRSHTSSSDDFRRPRPEITSPTLSTATSPASAFPPARFPQIPSPTSARPATPTNGTGTSLAAFLMWIMDTALSLLSQWQIMVMMFALGLLVGMVVLAGAQKFSRYLAKRRKYGPIYGGAPAIHPSTTPLGNSVLSPSNDRALLLSPSGHATEYGAIGTSTAAGESLVGSEPPQVRHFRMAVRAVLHLTDWSPEAMALALPDGSFSRADSDLFEDRSNGSTTSSATNSSGRPNSFLAMNGTELLVAKTPSQERAEGLLRLSTSLPREPRNVTVGKSKPGPPSKGSGQTPPPSSSWRARRGGMRPSLEIVVPSLQDQQKADASGDRPADMVYSPIDGEPQSPTAGGLKVTVEGSSSMDDNMYRVPSRQALALAQQKRSSDSSRHIPGNGKGPHLERSHFSSEHPHEWVVPGYGRIKFTDYAPLAFKAVREQFGYSTSQLTSSLEDSLRVQMSSGKSDSVFFIARNNRFMFKTLRGTEPDELRALLPEYLSYVHQNPSTLLPRYLGLYTFETVSHKPIYAILSQVFTVVVMASVFDTDLELHEKYDFKGSTVGRQTLKEDHDVVDGIVRTRRRRRSDGTSTRPGLRPPAGRPRPLSSISSTLGMPSIYDTIETGKPDPVWTNGADSAKESSVENSLDYLAENERDIHVSIGQKLSELTLKELDFQRLVGSGKANLIHLGPAKKLMVLNQLEADFAFLKKHGFMDYSVLVGIHRKPKAPTPAPRPQLLHRRFPLLNSLKGLTAPNRPLSFFFGGASNTAHQNTPNTSEQSSPLHNSENLQSSSSAATNEPPIPRPRSPKPAPSPSIRKSLFESLASNPTLAAIGRSMTPPDVAAARRMTVADVSALKVQWKDYGSIGPEGVTGGGSSSTTRNAGRQLDDKRMSLETVDGHSSRKSLDDAVADETATGGSNFPSTSATRGMAGRFGSGSSSSSERISHFFGGLEFHGDGDDDMDDIFAEKHNMHLPFAKRYHGGIKSEDLDSDTYDHEVYFIGIVDVLQKYNMVKWFERRISKPATKSSKSMFGSTRGGLSPIRGLSPPATPTTDSPSYGLISVDGSSTGPHHYSISSIRPDTYASSSSSAASSSIPSDVPPSLAGLFTATNTTPSDAPYISSTKRQRTRSNGNLVAAAAAGSGAATATAPTKSPTAPPSSVPFPPVGGLRPPSSASADGDQPLRGRRAGDESRAASRMARRESVDALFSTPEVSVEEPERYAARLMRYMTAITV